jgi:hypothetical protein
MKVEEGGVDHKNYDGYYTKQWVRIPKGYLNITHSREKIHMLNIL